MISFHWADKGYTIPMEGIEIGLIVMSFLCIPLSIVLFTYRHKKNTNILALLMFTLSIITIIFAVSSMNYQNLERETPLSLETSATSVS